MKKKSIKLLSLFSGIGAYEQAFKNKGYEIDLVGFSEINKYATQSYRNIYGVSEDKCLGDITKIDISSLPTDIDLITHGSPCQDFSVAGENKGGDKGTGTRSSLMWYTVDIVEHCKPKVVIWENVKNVLSKKHKHNFDGYLEDMDKLGYSNYYQVLNAKDYGIPQNRERIFVVSIRKDIDKGYVFPEPQELTLRLKDMLEDEVDEKYYISTCKVQQLLQNIGGKLDLSKQVIGTCHKNNDLSRSTRDRVYNAEKNAPTLSATMYKDAIKVLISIDDKNSKSVDYVSPTINTCGGGNLEPKIIEPIIVASRGRNPENPSDRRSGIPTKQRLEPNSRGIANTITTVQKDNYVLEPLITETAVVDKYRVRKLTPRECWRLMGFTDEQFDKASEVCSNTQLYKQAGNSIVVNVLEAIIDNLKEIL